MKSKFVSDQQDPFAEPFNPAWDDPDFRNFPPPVGQAAGSSSAATSIVSTPIAPTPALSN
jgi:hypothetical protein